MAQAQWLDHCVFPDDRSIPTLRGFECVFERVLAVALTLIGIGVFMMIVVGGFQLLTSSGDPQKAEAAKATIGWGIGGLAAAIGVWFVLLFISQVTGITNLLFFRILFE